MLLSPQTYQHGVSVLLLSGPHQSLTPHRPSLAVSPPASAQSASPLLCLLPELRNKIYEHVFGGNTIYIFNTSFSSKRYECAIANRLNPNEMWNRVQMFRASTALTRTSRQLHKETRLLPFVHGKFSWNGPYLYHWKSRNFAKWLNRIDDVIRAAVWTALDDELREFVLRDGGKDLRKALRL